MDKPLRYTSHLKVLYDPQWTITSLSPVPHIVFHEPHITLEPPSGYLIKYMLNDLFIYPAGGKLALKLKTSMLASCQ